ncbi:MAG: sulfite oxidase [Gammaproteobacteria bacterium]|nr:sulfite oxidase [Gammaproteobacteria bacterium]
MKKETGIHELFRSDPERADFLVWGRRSDPLTRRGFIKGLAGFSAIVGAEVVFHHNMPAGLIPTVFADSEEPFVIEGKSGLRVLNDRPLNAETPAHLLNDDVTPMERLFVRNNGFPPENVDADAWTLTVDGESAGTTKSYSISELKRRFPSQTLQLTLECGGNGRAEFYPPASGNQWTLGAVGCPEWNGIRLKDVLEDAGINDDAVYVAYYGADVHLSRQPGKIPISRGVPMSKALEDASLIAWGMNGEPLHPMNGHPLRLVFGGWPGSTSGKWLTRIAVRNIIHDGPKMTGKSYRMPCNPVAPGTKVADENMCIIEAMPVKSLITSPRNGMTTARQQPLALHGHAWAGDTEVAELHISIDFGRTWRRAELQAPANRLAWQNWDAQVGFPATGYYEVWARAVDSKGESQPMVIPGWNPKGYLNNSCHRIGVYVT